MCTWRFPLLASMLPLQPLVVSVPLPLAMGTPPQQKKKSPVWALTSTTFPGLESSCRQKLKAFTLNVQVAILPEASVAVQVTVVVPTGKVEPDGGLQTAVTPGQLSVAVTMKLTGPLVVAIGQETTATAFMLPGQVITGGVLSVTVTVNEHIGPAVVVQVTVVVPTGKQPPEAGLQLTVPQVPVVVGAG
jgi:hypothetical protein